MQNITIAGRVGADAKLAKTQGGDSVANFNVAVDYRDGREKATNWWRVSIWGKRADALAPYLLKGASVTVIGEFALGEYEGKPQLNVRANEIALQGSRNASGGQGSGDGSRGAPHQSGNAQAAHDLADDIPFITCNSIF